MSTWILLAAAITTTGNAHAAPAEVTGTVVYRQRIALPPEAVVHVRLEDVSRADGPATVIAEADIDRGGRQVPIAFRLEYEPSRIDPSHRYALRATIRSGERLLFTSTSAHPVITAGAPSHVEIVVTPAAVPTPPTAERALGPSIEGSFRMRGMYTYMADAAFFVDCSTGSGGPWRRRAMPSRSSAPTPRSDRRRARRSW